MPGANQDSSGGFEATVERPGGIQGRFGLWASDVEDESSNYRELRNLVETVEEEATAGHLINGELWLFTDNSTAESCFSQGGSSSKLLHELVLRLRKLEMDYGFALHVVHVAGSRMMLRERMASPEVASWKGSCRVTICSHSSIYPKQPLRDTLQFLTLFDPGLSHR